MKSRSVRREDDREKVKNDDLLQFVKPLVNKPRAKKTQKRKSWKYKYLASVACHTS